MRTVLIIFMLILINLPAFSQNGSWWEPTNPSPGDTITIFFDPTQNPEIPPNPTVLTLHWGVNESIGGLWQPPPTHLWPPGTVLAPDGIAARSPMSIYSGSVWFVKIPTDTTIYSVHYVVNDGPPQTYGPNWAHNTGGGNWNIILELVVPLTYPHTFLLDKRSYYNDFIDPITFAAVRGTYNAWGGSGQDTLLPTNNPEVLGRRVELPANVTLMYKFYLNGDRWIWDPDNPITNSGDHNNSVLYFYPDSQGYFYDLMPRQGEIFSDGSVINFQASVQPGISLSGIDPNTIQVALDASPVVYSFDPVSGLITGSLSNVGDGNHLLSFQAYDSLGIAFKPSLIHFGVYSTPPQGIFILDPVGDNTGSGNYQMPPFSTISASDLVGFEVTVNPAHDSLRFSIKLEDIDDYTRVGFYLLNNTQGFMTEALDQVNLQIREWNGQGVHIALSHPNSPYFDPNYENHLIVSHSPLQISSAISLSQTGLAQNVFQFSLSLAELEQTLGSFNHAWYVAAFTYLKDAIGTVVVTPDLGGDSTGWNPNIYDGLFYDYILDIPLQERLLSNFNNTHLAWLDAEGRGFLKFSPSDLDPNWTSLPPLVTITTRNAQTVLSTKMVRGTVSDTAISQIIISRNGVDTTVTSTNGEWGAEFSLIEGDNIFQARATNGGGTGYSGNLVITRWVDHAPQPSVTFINASGTMVLDASGSTDPDGDIVSFYWEMDPNNPIQVTLSNPNQNVVSFPKPSVPGEYYFNLTITDAAGHEGFKRSFLRITDSTANMFQNDQSADWLKDAIVYEIYLRSFSSQGNFQGVIQKLDYLQELGINCIWFMPIHESPDDHGYSVADYYSIESDYGSLADFQQLVDEAHARGIRVIIDHVVNHSSLFHLFAQDMVTYLKDSHYWNFYEHRRIGDTNGLGYGSYPLYPPYIWTYYSNWFYLPNLNLGHPDSRKYFIDMAKWWVDSLEIDGYRCDVAWGPINRCYNYWEEWREELKSLKPEALLLGELSAVDHNYAFTNRFDAAYDWNLFHQGYRSIWNSLDLNYLHSLITNYGYWWPEYKYNFRFMENHDEPRYIADFGVEKTKLIAALHLTVPGMPLLYAGQEVGETTQRGLIDWSDPNNLLPYYKALIHARRDFPAFTRGNYKQIGTISLSNVYAISRQYQDNIVIALFNFKSTAQTGQFAITISQYGLNPSDTYYLNDIITGEVIQTTGSQLGFQTVNLAPYQARVFILADSALTGIGVPDNYANKPKTFALFQNFPNPFNPVTNIAFDIPRTVKVKVEIYNILGQRVATLLEKPLPAGTYQVQWDGRNKNGVPVSSGIYILHFKAGDFVKNRRMLLLK